MGPFHDHGCVPSVELGSKMTNELVEALVQLLLRTIFFFVFFMFVFFSFVIYFFVGAPYPQNGPIALQDARLSGQSILTQKQFIFGTVNTA